MNYKSCPNYSASLKASDKPNDRIYVYKARCKQWSCPYCAAINARIWRARIMGEVEQNPDEQWFFWTLTLAGKDHKKSSVLSLQKWRQFWDKLLKRVRRDLGALRYVRVFEPHHDGTLHVHMLCDKSYSDTYEITSGNKQDGTYSKRMHSPTLAAHLKAVGAGTVHDIKPIVTDEFENNGNARNVSKYVTKYLTKEIQSGLRELLRAAGMPKVRIIQTTRYWYNKDTKEAELSWTRDEVRIGEFMSVSSVHDISRKREVELEDFHEFSYYPNKISDLLDIAEDQALD